MKGTVLIVEDQPNFREGLKFFIKQNSVHWRVIGEAESGDEGWRKTIELQPDLILMDIHMPVMSGIELAQMIHAHGLDTMFVMITGFQDFQYAQSALRFGALDFLLKPCSDEDISRILQLASDKLESKKKAQRAVREHTLRSILLKYQMNDELTDQLLQLFVNRQLWLIAIDTYFPTGKDYQEEDLYLLQYGIFNIIQEITCSDESQSDLLVLTEDQFVLSVSSAASITWQDHVVSVVRDYLGIPIECIPLGTCLDFSSLLSAYTAFCDQRLQPISGSLTMSEAIKHQAVQDIKNEIMSLIVSGEERSLSDYFSGIGQCISLYSLSEGKIIAINQTIALDQISDLLGISSPLKQSVATLLESMHQLHDSQQLLEWLREGYDDFAVRLEKWKLHSNQNGNMIKQALDYIRQHYLGALSLKEVAEQIHLNPSYFSTLFKKETGETFTNYVNKLKLQRAQVLLRNTDMKITEICQTVGFEDSTYFSSVFKKYFQVSPSEFRQNKPLNKRLSL